MISLEEFLALTNDSSGHHLRVCLRVVDTADDVKKLPFIQRSSIKSCEFCTEPVYYDPKATVYAPGEHIICQVCLEKIDRIFQ